MMIAPRLFGAGAIDQGGSHACDGDTRNKAPISCHHRLYVLFLTQTTVMKISYDPEIDALYIRLLEGKQECRSVRLSGEVALNIGAGEKLVGIEILDAKSMLGSGKVPAVMLEGLRSSSNASPARTIPQPSKVQE